MSCGAFGLSDHVMIHLIPTYRQKLKLFKPVVRTSKPGCGGASFCLDLTDWDVFRAANDILDEYMDTVTSYSKYCVDRIVPTFSRISHNNDKPCFTVKLGQLRLEEAALRVGGTATKGPSTGLARR